MDRKLATFMIQQQERRNREKWKDYHRTPAEHLLIATEELGEVARAMQGGEAEAYIWPPQYGPGVAEELIDLGAVVLAMLMECELAE